MPAKDEQDAPRLTSSHAAQGQQHPRASAGSAQPSPGLQRWFSEDPCLPLPPNPPPATCPPMKGEREPPRTQSRGRSSTQVILQRGGNAPPRHHRHQPPRGLPCCRSSVSWVTSLLKGSGTERTGPEDPFLLRGEVRLHRERFALYLYPPASHASRRGAQSQSLDPPRLGAPPAASRRSDSCASHRRESQRQRWGQKSSCPSPPTVWASIQANGGRRRLLGMSSGRN